MKKDVKNLYSEYPWIESIDSIIFRTALEDLDRDILTILKNVQNILDLNAKIIMIPIEQFA